MNILEASVNVTRSWVSNLIQRPLEEDRAFVSNVVSLFVLVFLLFMIDIMLTRVVSFKVSPDTIINLNSIISGISVSLAIFYTYLRFDKAIASILWSVALISLIIPLLCLGTYVACSYGSVFPLRDAALADFDRSLGFSWPALLAWAQAHPSWSDAGRIAYLSVFPQAAVAILTLSLTRQAERLQAVIYAFTFGAVICSAVSCLVPALGAYQYFGVGPDAHAGIALQVRALTVPTVLELRSGSFHEFFIASSQGIISFPSFHTVLGLLMIWAFWSVGKLRWIAASLNVVLIAATPLQGSHYLADVLAGGMVGVVAIRLGVALHVFIAGMTEHRASSPSTPIGEDLAIIS